MKKILLLSFLLGFSAVFAQDGFWSHTKGDQINAADKLKMRVIPDAYQVYSLDLNALKATLANAPKRENHKTVSGVLISMPNPDGTLEHYKVYEFSAMAPGLAARYNDIKAYIGVGVEHPSSSVRLTTTIFGLNAMMFTNDGTNFIDPYTKDRKNYIVYATKDLGSAGDFYCAVKGSPKDESHAQNKNSNQLLSDTGIFRTYRLALSTTIEYSNYHIALAGVGSGTTSQQKAAVLAAMNVTMVRVNGVYERDMSLTMVLVDNDDSLISLGTDSFSNDNGSALLGQNQTFVDNIIGSANYDIGHIFSTGGGGIASIRSVCVSGQKAQGVTGSPDPINDAFDIDYVAHEMGHQYGGNHTFNSEQGSCSGNRNPDTAVEPGSGSTIMAYAGICPPQNIQNHSDAHFSFISLVEMNAHVANTGNCSVNIPNADTPPVIGNLPDYTIPLSTPFILHGNATDAENDPLTFCWEQTDTGTDSSQPAADSDASPNFRSRFPAASPDRFMPPIANVILNNIAPTYEVVPSIPRSMDFALTVRDNNTLSGGQTTRKDMVVNFASVGPFLVTSPNTATTWAVGSVQTVTWDVAGTTSNGIDTPYVDIYLLTSSTNPFAALLASAVPNDGSEIITVPNMTGTTNRIIVKGHDNIFYDMSNANVTISTAATPTFSVAYSGTAGTQNISRCVNGNAVFTLNYGVLAGFSGAVTLVATGNPAGSVATFSSNPVSTAGPITLTISNITLPGTYPITVTATSGTTVKNVDLYLTVLDSNFSAVTLSTPANNSLGQSVNAVLTWNASANATSYDVQVATDNAFTNVVDSATVTGLTYTTATLNSLTDYYWRVLPKNEGCSGAYSSVFKFTTRYCDSFSSTNVPLTIAATGTPTVNSTLVVPAAAGLTISDIDVTLNITHSWINDLTVKLISPAGTQITLFSGVCSPTVSGYQDANATFDDSGNPLTCGATNPRISGRVAPAQALSTLNGQSSQGTWTLRVSDSASGDGGSINSWSLNICGQAAPLAVETLDPSFDFAVYPNPNNGNFTIESDKILSDIAKIMVYDMRGRTIFENEYTVNGKLNQSISLKNAQAGVYMLSISDGDRKEVKRIIIE